MSKVTKYAFIVGLVNIGVIALLAALLEITQSDAAGASLILIPGLMLIIELILGIVFAVGQKNSELGKGMLIGLGVTLLIGGAACGLIMTSI